MKDFLSRLGIFSGILGLMMLAITIFVPATPRTNSSLLYSKLDKEQLLETTSAPRLILMGGSNMSMSMDSSLLKEELGISPINTAIHASIGLDYMTDMVLEHIQPGDIVVVSLEYSQFYGSYMYGGEELLRTVFDVDRSDLGRLNLPQWLSILRFLPKYSASKVSPSDYFYKEQIRIDDYERGAFNEFGDATIHWSRSQKPIESYPAINKLYNRYAILLLIEFEQQVAEAGGRLVLTYPAIQEETFNNMFDQIKHVQNDLESSGLILLGKPENFIVDDSLLYDTPYHLTQEGALIRTQLLIDNLQSSGILK